MVYFSLRDLPKITPAKTPPTAMLQHQKKSTKKNPQNSILKKHQQT